MVGLYCQGHPVHCGDRWRDTVIYEITMRGVSANAGVWDAYNSLLRQADDYMDSGQYLSYHDRHIFELVAGPFTVIAKAKPAPNNTMWVHVADRRGST